MRQLQNQQINGDVDNDAEGSENEDYEFPSHEKHLVHVEMEIPEYDRVTGKKTSVAKIQKFYPKEFADQEKNNGFAGYEVRILHDPSTNGKVLDGVERVTAGGQSLGDAHHPDNKKMLLDEKNKAQSGGQSLGDKTGGDLVNDIKISKMNKQQLTETYNTLYGEVPDEALTVADLKEKIQEKLDFIKAENEGQNSGEAE